MQKRLFIFLLLNLITFSLFSCDARLLGVTISEKKWDFGAIDRTQSECKNFRLFNQTDLRIKINSISLDGANSSEFYFKSGAVSNYEMKPQEQLDIEIEYKPDTFGLKEAQLKIQTNFKLTPVLTVDLEGYCYSVDLAPTSFDFGRIYIGGSLSVDFVFTNNTNRDININSIDISGNNAGDFTLFSGGISTIPAMGGEYWFNIEFNAINFGAKSAELNILTDDVTFCKIIAELSAFSCLDLIETFDNPAMRDDVATTAEWGTVSPGSLTPTGLSNFGTGADGDFNPTVNTTLDADLGPYNFTSINIPAGVKVKTIGTQPLEIYCAGNVIIEGELNLDGKDGQNGGSGSLGGSGGPGGSAGGNGAARTGTASTAGAQGGGLGGGESGVDLSGGGGGFGDDGQDGESDAFIGAYGGKKYGTADLANLVGGSGGGGGATFFGLVHYFNGGGDGAGGGGGGGALLIQAAGNIEIKGLISARGGDGGGHRRPGGMNEICFGGGGGSGGAVKLISGTHITFDQGVIDVIGGMGDDGMVAPYTGRHRGGNGSPGRIRLEDSDGIIEGVGASIFPKPSMAYVGSPFAGGTGTDGAFAPTANITLDTTNGAFNYTSVNIPAGVTVKAIGPNPLEIFSTGNIVVEGKIDISGEDGVYDVAGVGKAGGHSGGAAGAGNSNGSPGDGPGGGHAGLLPWTSGSSTGGGFGTAGQQGSVSGYYPGGAIYGTPELTVLQGGSGGGGGAGCFDVGGGNGTDPGGGGGAGGGALRLQAAGSISISGEIIAEGGAGGEYGGMFAHPGSGGSGGAILLQATTFELTGKLNARGGPGGPAAGVICSYTRQNDECYIWQGSFGGEGRIRIETVYGNLGALLYTTKGKFSTPFMCNDETDGTCSVDNLSVNAGLQAQSKFFDSTTDDPIWGQAVITGTDTNQVFTEFQGAEDDGNGLPDMNTLTAWVSDLSTLSNTKFVRFRLTFKSGIGNPVVDEIQLTFN